jgi:hypothetical protein
MGTKWALKKWYWAKFSNALYFEESTFPSSFTSIPTPSDVKQPQVIIYPPTAKILSLLDMVLIERIRGHFPIDLHFVWDFERKLTHIAPDYRHPVLIAEVKIFFGELKPVHLMFLIQKRVFTLNEALKTISPQIIPYGLPGYVNIELPFQEIFSIYQVLELIFFKALSRRLCDLIGKCLSPASFDFWTSYLDFCTVFSYCGICHSCISRDLRVREIFFFLSVMIFFICAPPIFLIFKV